MKARIPTPLEQLNAQRTKGRELIKKLRDQGYNDETIAKKLGVPYEKWGKFLWQIGMIEVKPTRNFKNPS
jgi:site-specific recombinase XerC